MTPEEKKKLLRKYAGMAMQGLLSDSTSLECCIDAGKQLRISLTTAIARNAIAYANALIKELEEVEE